MNVFTALTFCLDCVSEAFKGVNYRCFGALTANGRNEGEYVLSRGVDVEVGFGVRHLIVRHLAGLFGGVWSA
jgi:hypothetical protein